MYKITLDTQVIKIYYFILFFFNFFFTDLKTMSERLKNRYYCNKRLFIADMNRIFTNCRAYNQPDTDYYKCANSLEKFFQSKMKESNLWDKWPWLD